MNIEYLIFVVYAQFYFFSLRDLMTWRKAQENYSHRSTRFKRDLPMPEGTENTIFLAGGRNSGAFF